MTDSEIAPRGGANGNGSPSEAMTVKSVSPAQPVASKKPQRAIAVLGHGRSVVVVGRNLTLDSWLKTLQEALAKGRRAKSYGVELDSFLKMLRDMGQ